MSNRNQQPEPSTENPLKKTKNTKKSSFLKEAVSLLFSVAIAFVLFLLIRAFIFFPFQVSGNSMYPNLQDGDRLILNRLSSLDRFDVVVFPSPVQMPDEENQEFVKRIIGVPGDEIVYQGDQLFINGEPIDEPYLDELKSQLNRQLTNDFTLMDIPGSDSNVVPEGKYLVLGDNRVVSRDSRILGYIDAEDIDGATSFRFWPLDRIGILTDYNK